MVNLLAIMIVIIMQLFVANENGYKGRELGSS